MARAVRAEGDTNEAILARLRDLVETLPVPTTPRPRSRGDEELGLGILELSLRLSHVSRLTEHLDLIERSHLGRRISLDVDLHTLSHRHRDAIGAGNESGERDYLWVPIARYDRSDLAAVVVTDGESNVVPRLTNRETIRVTIAAVLQLFRLLLDADSAGQPEDNPILVLRTEGHRARWLIESAIATVIEEGLPVPRQTTFRGTGRDRSRERGRERLFDVLPDGRRASQWPEPEATLAEVALPADRDAQEGIAERSRAVETLAKLFDPLAESTFLPLLQLAVAEHPLVVLLSSDTPKQYLSFEAPHLRDRSPHARRPGLRRVRSSLSAALNPRQEFMMEYETSIPRSVNSFHVSLTVDPTVRVRHCFMSTSSDLALVETLRADMAQCAVSSRELLRDGNAAILDHELASIASRLRELSARRSRDLSRFWSAWNLDFGTHLKHSRAGTDPDLPIAEARLVERAHPVCSLVRFGHEHSTGGYRQLAGASLDVAEINDAAAVLDDQNLGWDLTADNDPREDHAHVHWRRAEQPQGSRSTDPLTARVVVTLADDPPSLAASVGRMTLALAVLVAAIVVFLDHSLLGLVPWVTPSARGSFESAEAAVTILLLVPGLMLSRLDLPSTKTVLGQLRLLSRVAAYAAVTVTTGIAAYVGLRQGHDIALWPLATGVWVLLGIGAYIGLSLGMQAYTDSSLVPRSAMLPRWLAQECTRRDLRDDLPPSAFFSVVEGTQP